MQYTCITYHLHSGVHLEIDPRGREMSIYEKEGGQSTCTLGGSGGMLPQKTLDFTLFKTIFWCILRDFVLNREFLIWKQL